MTSLGSIHFAFRIAINENTKFYNMLFGGILPNIEAVRPTARIGRISNDTSLSGAASEGGDQYLFFSQHNRNSLLGICCFSSPKFGLYFWDRSSPSIQFHICP